MALEYKKRVIEGLLLVVLSICLPTVDTVLDIHFCALAILGGHYHWGLSLLAPVLLNFSFTICTWWKLDRGETWTEDKRWTWVLLVLLAWPQWRAVNLLFSIAYHGEEEALERKKEFERRVGGLEPFMESAPQVCNKNVLHFL